MVVIPNCFESTLLTIFLPNSQYCVLHVLFSRILLYVQESFWQEVIPVEVHFRYWYRWHMFLSIIFLQKSTFFNNWLPLSIHFLYQSIFFINGLYMSMDISLSVNWLDSSLAQLIKIFKTFSLVIQHVLLRLKKVTCWILDKIFKTL